MRHAERCVFWKRPNDDGDAINSLFDAAVDLPEGKVLIYRHDQTPTKPEAIFRLAGEVASRLGLALVQWPECPPRDSQHSRRWLYGLQRRSAA